MYPDKCFCFNSSHFNRASPAKSLNGAGDPDAPYTTKLPIPHNSLEFESSACNAICLEIPSIPVTPFDWRIELGCVHGNFHRGCRGKRSRKCDFLLVTYFGRARAV